MSHHFALPDDCRLVAVSTLLSQLSGTCHGSCLTTSGTRCWRRPCLWSRHVASVAGMAGHREANVASPRSEYLWILRALGWSVLPETDHRSLGLAHLLLVPASSLT